MSVGLLLDIKYQPLWDAKESDTEKRKGLFLTDEETRVQRV